MIFVCLGDEKSFFIWSSFFGRVIIKSMVFYSIWNILTSQVPHYCDKSSESAYTKKITRKTSWLFIRTAPRSILSCLFPHFPPQVYATYSIGGRTTKALMITIVMATIWYPLQTPRQPHCVGMARHIGWLIGSLVDWTQTSTCTHICVFVFIRHNIKGWGVGDSFNR